MSKIQSILFDRRMFTISSAIQWLEKHKFKHNKVDIKRNYYRFRQFNPKPYDNYRTIILKIGIKAIMEY